jgi:hypothetical protein
MLYKFEKNVSAIEFQRTGCDCPQMELVIVCIYIEIWSEIRITD